MEFLYGFQIPCLKRKVEKVGDRINVLSKLGNRLQATGQFSVVLVIKHVLHCCYVRIGPVCPLAPY